MSTVITNAMGTEWSKIAAQKAPKNVLSQEDVTDQIDVKRLIDNLLKDIQAGKFNRADKVLAEIDSWHPLIKADIIKEIDRLLDGSSSYRMNFGNLDDSARGKLYYIKQSITKTKDKKKNIHECMPIPKKDQNSASHIMRNVMKMVKQ